VLEYISELTGIQIEPLWTDESRSVGLDRDRAVALRFNSIAALALVERVLEAVSDDSPGDRCTWQFTANGTLQVGPRARLNEYKRVEVYPIGDLVRETPKFVNAPTMDLQSALHGQGAGGGSVFKESPQYTPGAGPGGVELQSPQKRADRLASMLTDLIEPDQWVDHGGSGAQLIVYQGAFIVNAPEYVHRQINGSRAR